MNRARRSGPGLAGGVLLAALLACAGGGPANAGPSAATKTASTASKAARKPASGTRTRRPTPNPATPPSPRASALDPKDDQARQTEERDRLTARIADLRRQIADGERSRSGAAAALARAEQALADVNRHLADLSRRQRATQELAASLERQRLGTEERIANGEREIVRTISRWSANQDRDPLHTYLTGGLPDDAVLDDAYLRAIARAEAADVESLRARQNDLESRRRRADDDARALIEQADAERSAREALASDQAAQRQALAQLSQKLAAQRSTAAALEADEKRLSRVVAQLQRVIEQRAAEERARREVARRLAEQEVAAKRGKGSTRAPSARPTDPAPPPVDDGASADVGDSAFARSKGQLRWPVRGVVAGRFGAARGDGGATWKGVFLKTDGGADVHAVAAGTVIFADDLRGFGNLLIVDHGGQYLSIYGNNETLLKRPGDRVQSGDVISRAGNSSGDDRTGLYFELRFRGKPFDPAAWLSGR